MPAGVRHADLRGHCPTGCSPSGRPTPRATVRPTSSTRSSGSSPDGRRGAGLRPDFVSDPRLAPDGVTLSWLQWDHPNMPWDAAQLVVRAADGTEHVIAGGPGESVVQPVWGDDLALWWFSDRTDVWSLYRKRPHERARARPRRGQRHRRSAVGVRAEPLRAARRRPGRVRLRPRRRRPARRPRARRERARARRALQRRSGTSPRRARRSSASPASPSQRAGRPAGRRRRRGAGDPPPGPRPRPGPGLVLPPGARDLPDRGPRHRHRRRARAGLPADQPGGARPPTATCRR